MGSSGEPGGANMMRVVNTFLGVVVLMFVFGCAGQQSHERTMQALEETPESAGQKIEGLQQVVQEKQAEIAKLQAIKTELEQTVEVQDQMKEQHFTEVKQELEALYAQVQGRDEMSGEEALAVPLFEVEPVDFDDLTDAIKHVRSILDIHVGDTSQLQKQNSLLEEELSSLESRLKEVERLKDELEQVQRVREIQETQLAKVKKEVLTVGEEIDRITKALEEKFGKSLVVTQQQDRLVLTVLGQVLFESGEAELTPLGFNIMKQVGQILATLPDKYIQVEGHTDNNPIYGRLQQQYPTNWELSTARATTVLRYLIEQTGMAPKDFAATGYADVRPVATNETEEGRAQNRRVEIVLYPEQAIHVRDTVATLSQ
jgi:chemotaxis protein MotB